MINGVQNSVGNPTYFQPHLNRQKSVLWASKNKHREASKVVGVMNRRNEHQRQLSSKTEGGLKIVYYCIEQFHLEYRLGKMSFYSLQHCTVANKYKNEWWLRKWNRAHSSLKLLYNTGCLKSHYANVTHSREENLVSYSKLHDRAKLKRWVICMMNNSCYKKINSAFRLLWLIKKDLEKPLLTQFR